MDSYGIFDRGSCVEVLLVLSLRLDVVLILFIPGTGLHIRASAAPNRRPLTECPDPPMIIRSLVSPLPNLSLLHCIIGEQSLLVIDLPPPQHELVTAHSCSLSCSTVALD